MRIEDILETLHSGSFSKIFTWLSTDWGLPVALAGASTLIITRTLWRYCLRYWQQLHSQLVNEKESLDPRLLYRLESATGGGQLLHTLAVSDALFERIYGIKPWGLLTLERAFYISLIYSIVLFFSNWLFGGAVKIGYEIVLPADTIGRARLLLALTLAGQLALAFVVLSGFAYRKLRILALLAGMPQDSRLLLVYFEVSLLFYIFDLNARVLQSETSIGPLLSVAVACTWLIAALYCHSASSKHPVLYNINPRNANSNKTTTYWYENTLAYATVATVLLTLPLWSDFIEEWLGLNRWYQKDDLKSLPIKNNVPFPIVYFFLALPSINAVCDYVSISATRTILRFYLRRPLTAFRKTKTLWPLLLLLDILLALLLVLILLVGVISSTVWLGYLGFAHVNTERILAEFQSASWWDGGSFWLIGMAITNLVPTFVHLIVVAEGKVSQRWSGVYRELPGWLLRLKSGKRISSTEADRLLMYLFVFRYIWLTLFSLIVLLVGWILSFWILKILIPVVLMRSFS